MQTENIKESNRKEGPIDSHTIVIRNQTLYTQNYVHYSAEHISSLEVLLSKTLLEKNYLEKEKFIFIKSNAPSQPNYRCQCRFRPRTFC